MAKERGRFIVFEGVEGAGKSTHLRLLATTLRRRGLDVVETREPGGTPLGLEIRRLLLEVRSDPPQPAAELFLYLADRAQHVAEVVRPALAQGKVVLSDRFSWSTLAYQGFGRGLDRTVLEQADALARGGLWPDLILLLDCPVLLGLERAGRGDRFHQEAVSFHERIRAAFLEMVRESPTPTAVIDTTAEPDAVQAAIEREVERCLKSG